MILISKELGISTYNDWYEVKKHDLAYNAIPIEEYNVKSMDIRLLIRQLDKGIEFSEIELDSLESEVNFLRELKEIVDSFNKEINELYATKKDQDYKVWIFDGRERNDTWIDFKNVENTDDNKAILGSKLKLLTKKKYLVSEHLE